MTRNSGLLSRDVTDEVTNLILENLSDSPRDTYLRGLFLSKFADPSPKLAEERKDRAIAKWLATESRNSRTNLRLFLLDTDKVLGGLPLPVVLDYARRTIKRLIGSEVPWESLTGSFSAGASTSLRRMPGNVARKYVSQLDVTHEAWDLIWPWIYRDTKVWMTYNPGVLEPRFVDHNIMFTVPKNDTIDRVACKEPDLNMYAQKACGDFIRRRLRLVGIDLNDQTRNQELAHSGSVSNLLATVDLSSASDSVTTQLVCALLPTDWFVTLDRLRCKTTRLPDGTLHQNEMFSSMGNGFTFELESLIFYALTKAVQDLLGVRSVVSVYGDDIIMSSSVFGPFLHVFNYLGFIINKDKSFVKGPIRESCGKHYYNGVDITPFYIRERIITVPRLIHVLNLIRGWASRGTSWCDPDWYRVWKTISRHVPNKRLFGGHDCTSIETVASPFGASYRLVPVRKLSRPDKLVPGMYLEWMANAEQRPAHCVTESISNVVVESRHVYRLLKPRRHFAFAFGQCAPAFPQEYELPDH